MIRDQFVLDVHQEIIVDNFAGGGGASTGIEMALGRCVDIAINHDPEAVTMHEINHPQTRHYCESVWDVDPLEATQGRPVGLAWFSPDCKHFSKAKGGKPRDKRIRGLAWIVLRWAALVRPRVIMLENVEEFRTWGPLLENGQPCPARKGQTFRSFVHQLQEKGYAVDHRELRACDYGAPTIRKRLFLIARCDGQPIVWPQPTHGAPTSPEVLAGLRKPWLTAADCIDWSILCPSIFERDRPLAEATLKRIARGIRRYVIEADKPFIVKVNHGGDDFRGQPVAEPIHTLTAKHGTGVVAPYLTPYHSATAPGGDRVRSLQDPLGTQTTENRFAVVTPFLTEHANGSTQRNFDAGDPLRTQCAEVKGGHFAMVSAFLAKHYGGNYDGPGAPLDGPAHTATTVDHHAVVAASLMTNTTGHTGAAASSPVPTLTTGGHHAVVAAQLVGCGGRAGQSRPRDAGEPAQTLTAKADTCIVTSHLAKLRNNQFGQATEEPMPTLTAGGGHVADVRAFLVKYYSEGGQDQDCRAPMHTIPTKDRIGLVTVAGQEYVIADIGMRMLEPHELYAAQGFPATYVIAPTVNGRRLPKHAQVRMCGNSVCPPLAAALVRANVPDMAAWTPKEAKERRIAA
ncbi:DNA cytosine methyltransferase [Bordetella bronchialis]|uniref:DNA (cytosine-5-)-methyltransferase n=1 Tax=Bordetella bronchialis TaxID=463025 RepID=A0A193FUM7_9BORD|nr:DNA cytosine methyltransferase [Bordetella bronchialis]ANN70886.1 type II restriction endonuclease subunit M [Bordetella bronchialis]